MHTDPHEGSMKIAPWIPIIRVLRPSSVMCPLWLSWISNWSMIYCSSLRLRRPMKSLTRVIQTWIIIFWQFTFGLDISASPFWGSGCAAVWFLYGFSCDLRVLFREANCDRASRGREANVRGEKLDECYNFWFIYKTCLAGNQNPLKLHTVTSP